MIVYKKGDLLKAAKESKFDIVIHGCNPYNTMGAGIALQIKKQFPEVYAADCKTNKGDINKIGTFSYHSYPFCTFVNAYTQNMTMYSHNMFSYFAFERAFESIKSQFGEVKYAIPFIGCGIAGGDWGKVVNILDKLQFNCTVVVYSISDLKQNCPNLEWDNLEEV